MYVNGSTYVHGPQTVAAPHRAAQAAPTRETGPAAAVDQLDISSAAHEASLARDASGIRQDKVAALRAAIANGSYETPEKLDVALSRLLDTLG